MRPVRVAVGAGLLAALYLLVLYLANPVPARFVRLAGGSGDGLGRHGGVRLVWQPPAGVDLDALAHALTARGTTCRTDGGRLVIEVAGASGDELAALIDMFTSGGLELREVLEVPEMARLAEVLALPMRDAAPVDLAVDQWRPDGAGAAHTDYYLLGTSRQALEDALARARAAGWSLPPHTQIAYQHLDSPTAKWRTYVVSDQVALDGSAVASAVGSYDPNTNRPIVLLDFTRAGAETFGELTARIRGHKLATILGGVVKSAPVINDAIRGGRASITMGGGDPRTQERERDDLVYTLKTGALPRGGTLLSEDVIAPTDGPVQLWLGRLLLALGGGALVGLLAWIVVRVTRPVRRRAPPRAVGPIPASRVLVTLLAPAAVLALSYIPVPALDSAAFSEMMRRPAREVLNLGSLGLTPLVSAYLLANLVRWAMRRRAPSGHVIVVLAILFTALQAWMLTTYLQSFELEDLLPRTSFARLEVVVAFGAATAFLAGIAAVIRDHGLGNGFAALIASGWVVMIGRVIAASPPAAPLAVALAEIVAVAVPVVVVLRWRVYGVGEAALRVPASGILPVAQAGGVALALGALAWTDLGAVSGRALDALMFLRAHVGWAAATAAALAVAWSAAFAWPREVSWSVWRRAVVLTVALVGALFALYAVAAAGQFVTMLTAPVFVAITAAYLLDAYDDLRARRVELERVWSVCSAQDAEQVERTLHDAGIPCHLACSHVRTVLGGFGAFAPVDVLVATEHVPAARTLLSSG